MALAGVGLGTGLWTTTGPVVYTTTGVGGVVFSGAATTSFTPAVVVVTPPAPTLSTLGAGGGPIPGRRPTRRVYEYQAEGALRPLFGRAQTSLFSVNVYEAFGYGRLPSYAGDAHTFRLTAQELEEDRMLLSWVKGRWGFDL